MDGWMSVFLLEFIPGVMCFVLIWSMSWSVWRRQVICIQHMQGHSIDQSVWWKIRLLHESDNRVFLAFFPSLPLWGQESESPQLVISESLVSLCLAHSRWMPREQASFCLVTVKATAHRHMWRGIVWFWMIKETFSFQIPCNCSGKNRLVTERSYNRCVFVPLRHLLYLPFLIKVDHFYYEGFGYIVISLFQREKAFGETSC